MSRKLFSVAIGSIAAIGVSLPIDAKADEFGRLSLLEENDSLYDTSDKHFTQGLRLSFLSPDIASNSAWNGPFDFVGALAPLFSSAPKAGDRSRRYAMFVGQSIFTPTDKTTTTPDPTDRPYAGWAYVGVSLLQETNRSTLDHLEVTIGLVGPGALGKQAQNDFHQFIGAAPAHGWSYQLRNELAGMVSYERLWRVPLFSAAGLSFDIVPQAGATIGTVATYGAAGGMIRFGRNLQADYGPARIRPALSGTDYFDADHLDGNFGFYVFAGTQGRIVGRNIFLDGNTFRSGPSVDKKLFVGDLQAGLSLFWSNDIQAVFSAVRRTREYDNQPTPDVIGTASLSFAL
ncbi:lipid A deacylase LpxR family protein [Magnetospirillum fulvum]|uniref:Lipid A deacylase LpxR family protein n=1 Tax=Magnetospirillum fulvum TaxID=1082 RepID=A0A1H6GR77_MAGFU|nr:lipid A deacylase LpxR family protein [Magnetospirillum fulvum]SEH25917.1 hypothetical protein SAMN04244559_00341 [Magnetospirillum fulvum]